jgi:hypothetical protein
VVDGVCWVYVRSAYFLPMMGCCYWGSLSNLMFLRMSARLPVVCLILTYFLRYDSVAALSKSSLLVRVPKEPIVPLRKAL